MPLWNVWLAIGRPIRWFLVTVLALLGLNWWVPGPAVWLVGAGLVALVTILSVRRRWALGASVLLGIVIAGAILNWSVLALAIPVAVVAGRWIRTNIAPFSDRANATKVRMNGETEFRITAPGDDGSRRMVPGSSVRIVNDGMHEIRNVYVLSNSSTGPSAPKVASLLLPGASATCGVGKWKNGGIIVVFEDWQGKTWCHKRQIIPWITVRPRSYVKRKWRLVRMEEPNSSTTTEAPDVGTGARKRFRSRPRRSWVLLPNAFVFPPADQIEANTYQKSIRPSVAFGRNTDAAWPMSIVTRQKRLVQVNIPVRQYVGMLLPDGYGPNDDYGPLGDPEDWDFV